MAADKYVGKHYYVLPKLKNTYLIESGLLIPRADTFFGDSCARAITHVSSVFRAYEYMQEEGLEQDSPEIYQNIKKIASKESYDENIRFAREVVDEVLLIASPEHSYGIADLEKLGKRYKSLRGRFDERFISFFNPENLVDLLDLLSLEHYDIVANKPAGTYPLVLEYWTDLQGQYNKHVEEHHEHCPLNI